MASVTPTTNVQYMKDRDRRQGIFLSLPAVVWLGIFFMLPVLIVLAISFLTPTTDGAGGQLPLTLNHYADAFDFWKPRPIYSAVILRSVWISLLTTIICLLLGYPLSFFIATRKSQAFRQFAMFLIIMPFWTNFLVRTYALKTIIAPEGPLASILTTLGGLGILQDGKLNWLNTREAVILGLVYSYLPFMVLPIYAVVEKFDFRFVEAANDLGANDLKTFFRVVVPMTAPGLVAGFILVFIPTIGAFVTPDLLGGTQGLMISNLIQQNIRGSGANYPRGSALSAVLMILVTVGVIIYLRYGSRETAR
ncbi:MAG: ABC transporter permease [Chloroflexi bacterium]|nr:ABC transporter permease [Chloroflexota bacterium]